MSVDRTDLSRYRIHVADVIRNAPPARLHKLAIVDQDAAIATSGALATRSGDKTGRSRKDKRMVDHPSTTNDIWRGDVSIRLTKQSFFHQSPTGDRLSEYTQTHLRL